LSSSTWRQAAHAHEAASGCARDRACLRVRRDLFESRSARRNGGEESRLAPEWPGLRRWITLRAAAGGRSKGLRSAEGRGGTRSPDRAEARQKIGVALGDRPGANPWRPRGSSAKGSTSSSAPARMDDVAGRGGNAAAIDRVLRGRVLAVEESKSHADGAQWQKASLDCRRRPAAIGGRHEAFRGRGREGSDATARMRFARLSGSVSRSTLRRSMLVQWQGSGREASRAQRGPGSFVTGNGRSSPSPV